MENQQKYSLGEIRGYLVALVALLEKQGQISETEGFTAMKVLNSLIFTLSNPQAKQMLNTIIKFHEAQGGPKQDEIIAQMTQQ